MSNIIKTFLCIRFIFGLNLDLLKEKLDDGTISISCPDAFMTHVLKMTNTSSAFYIINKVKYTYKYIKFHKNLHDKCFQTFFKVFFLLDNS